MTKVTIYISDPEAVVTNGYMKTYCHNTRVLDEDEDPDGMETWIRVGEIEYDEEMYLEQCRKIALSGINKQEKRCQAEYSKDLNELEIRKQSLLALTHEVTTDV